MNHLSVEKILSESQAFLDQVFSELENDCIDVSNMELDHICYRVETDEHYLQLKESFRMIGKLLVASEIGGREIATFKLFEPIKYLQREIYVIELPAPKKGSFYKEGFEHVEFVLNSDFDSFIKKYPNITFQKKGLSKRLNADIKRVYPQHSVKFHLQSLEEVIRIELNQK